MATTGEKLDYLFIRAIRCGWQIPDAQRSAVVARLVKLATDPSTHPNAAIKAARALASLDAATNRGLETAAGVVQVGELSTKVEALETVIREGRR